MKTFPATLLLDISKDYAHYRTQRENSWYGNVDGDSWGALPFAARSLYRGQNAHHFPLLPSIARGLQSSNIDAIWRSPIADQALIVLRLAQSWWFSRELTHHPVAQHAADLKVDLDPIALAQHYGLSTGYLDLTDDFSVGAFFATCRKTADGWEPVSSGIGVIYQVTLNAGFDSPVAQYAPLGPQPLPRPTEQCAWVTELPLCHSFDDWPNVSILRFEHDKRVGEHFLKMYDGGCQLFPVDPLADVASEILSCRAIPSDLIDKALNSFADDPYGLRRSDFPLLQAEIANMAILIHDRRLLKQEQVDSLLADPVWRNKMLSDVRLRWKAVRRVPIVDGLQG